jgi:hypothetical protein
MHVGCGSRRLVKFTSDDARAFIDSAIDVAEGVCTRAGVVRSRRVGPDLQRVPLRTIALTYCTSWGGRRDNTALNLND